MREVSTTPGQSAFTRTPARPTSRAMHAVIAWRPAFDAVYADAFGPNCLPAIDEMFTIEPPRPPSISTRPKTFTCRRSR